MQGLRSTNKARVLFVDDEKRVLNSMRGMFRRDFDLFLATEGATALQIAAETPIDVIVADQRMPGMTGIEVLGKVKEMSPNTIRILLTGYADPGAVEGSINVGEVFRFLGKPCPPKLLRETLNLAIDATRGVRSAASQVPDAENPARPQTAEPVVTRAELTRTTAKGQHSHATLENRPTDSAPSPAAPPAQGPGDEKLLSRLTSIGEVAFAWDRFKRKHNSHPQPAARATKQELGVVLYTVDSVFAETAIRALSAKRNTTLATSLINVMTALEKTQPGILVTDISTNGARLQKILSALKQLRPDLVTVVVSNSSDTTDMVNLINHGQIFRYLQKPVAAGTLIEAIDAAAVKSLELRTNPDAMRRHSVVPASPTLTPVGSLQRALRGNGQL